MWDVNDNKRQTQSWMRWVFETCFKYDKVRKTYTNKYDIIVTTYNTLANQLQHTLDIMDNW